MQLQLRHLKRLWSWCGAVFMLALGNQAAAQVCADPGSSMLWEVSGPGLGDASVTMHLLWHDRTDADPAMMAFRDLARKAVQERARRR